MNKNHLAIKKNPSDQRKWYRRDDQPLQHNDKRKRSFSNRSINWKQEVYSQDMNEVCEDKYKKHKKEYRDYREDHKQRDNKIFSKQSSQNEMHKKRVHDSEIQELIIYYEKILQDMKQGFMNESRDVYAKTVLQESKGKEVELSCLRACSHCFELLISDCNDHSVLEPFMTAFAKQKNEVFSNGNASHITELLIWRAIENIKSCLSDPMSDEEKVILNSSITWLQDLGEFVLENISSCLSNIYSCHVVCTLVRALGGDMSKVKDYMSKKSKTHKEEFHQSIGMAANITTRANDPVILEKNPESFNVILRKLSKLIVTSESVLDYATDSSAATVIQALLFVLRKRIPKRCKKFISNLASKIFSQTNENGTPLALFHTNRSFVVDEMFRYADEEMQDILWQAYFAKFLQQLVIHPVANYIIQRQFDVAISKTLFSQMCQAIWDLFDVIHQHRHYGIFISMANACNRLKAEQAQFMKNIMQCLQCAEPEDLQSHLLPLLIGFRKFEKCNAEGEKASFRIPICLQGSLVAQSILKFQKPIKVVKSILDMKPDEIAYLACHVQGCHVLNAFFSSTTVGEKNKEKLLHLFKPTISSVVCDRNGSLTLSRLWMLLSLKQKEIIAKELVQNEKNLQTDRNGSIILKKCGIFQYRHDYNKWKEIQDNLMQKGVKKF